jgi:hypothetical protein
MQNAIRWLYRSDLIYSDYEDAFCSGRLREIYPNRSESEFFFKGPTEKPKMKNWEIIEEYNLCEPRSPRKSELFFLLLNEDPEFRNSKIAGTVIGPTTREINKIVNGNKKSAVKYFPKYLNAKGFPIRSWEKKADSMWWLQRIKNPNEASSRYVRKKSLEKKVGALRKLPEVTTIGYIPQEKVRQMIKNRRALLNLEELSYWIMVMSSRLRYGVTDEEYVDRMFDDFKRVWPQKTSIRMADVKIFYTLHEGMSKLDFLNTD